MLTQLPNLPPSVTHRLAKDISWISFEGGRWHQVFVDLHLHPFENGVFETPYGKKPYETKPPFPGPLLPIPDSSGQKYNSLQDTFPGVSFVKH